ncbi:MAG: hypothetical protein CMH35_00065 [Microbacterium sp.]|nr:hypothetical protein [Microbacterium sp.]
MAQRPDDSQVGAKRESKATPEEPPRAETAPDQHATATEAATKTTATEAATETTATEAATETSSDEVKVSPETRDAYDKVPSIGTGWRWYDIPYKALEWLSSGWRRKLLPRKALERLNYGLNYLIPFNEHERDKVWDRKKPMHSFELPDDEHVTMPGVWVVELFPPSQFPLLEEAVRRNEWDKHRRLTHREANHELLVRSRTGSGWMAWDLAQITDINSSRWSPDGTKEKLPKHFEAVSLRAIQIGSGLTAVVAHFHLHDIDAKYLDSVWHSAHEPILLRRKGSRPHSLNHKFAAFHNTQSARHEIHDAARQWMRDQIPGFFASMDEPHTVIDMLLTDLLDPLDTGEPPHDLRDAYRALGLTEYFFYQYTSADIPKFRLMPTRDNLAPAATSSRRVWALWAQKQAAIDAAGDRLDMYGADKDEALAHRYSDAIQSFLVPLGISHFLEAAEAQYAEVRDRARVRHGHFNTRAIESLRETLLTLSLDLSSAYRDIQIDWKQRPKFYGEAEFTLQTTKLARERDKAEGRKPFESEHVNTTMRERQAEGFERLIGADHDYRDLLSTVASLGASADSSKLGRVALWVALASLGVAVLTLLLADTGNGSLLESLLSLAG